MKRLLFLFFFYIIPIFSFSHNLIDAECYQEVDGAIKIKLDTGTLYKNISWRKKVLLFNKDSKTWHYGDESFSSLCLCKVLQKINNQEIKDSFFLDKGKIKDCLDEVVWIAARVKYRDPVRFTTFYDNVLVCAGFQTDLFSLLIAH